MKDLFIKTSERTTISIRPNDVGFCLHDGVVVAHRAAFEISKHCPNESLEIILRAIDRGWLKPVATVPKNDPTLIVDILKS